MSQFTELEHEYLERRLTECVQRCGRAKPRRARGRVQRMSNLDYWTQALECHRAGRSHEGVDRIRKEYARNMTAAVRCKRPVGKAVAASEAYRKAAENRRRYQKGLHTSFANSSAAVDDSMRAKRGYKAKRQDGKKIKPEHLADIDAIVTDFESVLGPLADLFRRTDLTIAHTNGKHPFMRNFGGIYDSSERTVSVGVAIGGEPVRAGAHELAHWLDAEARSALGVATRSRNASRGYDTTYLSDDASRDASDPEWRLLHDAGRSMSRKHEIRRAFSTRTKRTVERDRARASLGPYWHRPLEIFARLVEQWLATELGDGCAAADSPEAYEGKPGYWAAADFDELMPDVRRAVERRIGLLRPAGPGLPPVVRSRAAQERKRRVAQERESRAAQERERKAAHERQEMETTARMAEIERSRNQAGGVRRLAERIATWFSWRRAARSYVHRGKCSERRGTMKVEVKDGKLIITLDLQPPTPSATGKTLVVASSRGNQPTTAMIDGKPIIVGVNAYIRK